MSFGASHREERAPRGICGTSDLRTRGVNVGGHRETWERDTGAWGASFRSGYSVLRDRAVKADLERGRAQNTFQEADPRICHSGPRTEKNEPPVASVGPRTPERRRGERGPDFSLATPIQMHWPCPSHALCVPISGISTRPNSGTPRPTGAKLSRPHPPWGTCEPLKAEPCGAVPFLTG
ncbi:hypothetical protein CRENBAI_000448 [Crenichthys baileyi]|uniref:Uncharacterized protein n=1 Tax=Crenichthys baileyi TaxID=28760 RepID=A0AAV9QWY4_9TELE